ncbi:MAG: acyltransferase family protein [Actinomycetes bacterium]
MSTQLRPVQPSVGDSGVGAQPGGGTSRQGSAGALRFRPDVEGLRAVAVLAVVLYHAGVPGLTGGFVGVDVFFVLSGFLITGLLVGEITATGRVSISNFYARRARRILPAATTVLVATSAATYFLVPLLDRAAVGWDIITAGLFASNWRFAIEGNDYGTFDQAPSPVLNYWSLGVEEQFYVVWPLLLVLFAIIARRRGANPKAVLAVVVAVVAGASLWLSITTTTSNQPMAFFSSPTRAWELAAGALVALLGAAAVRIPRALRALLGWAGLGVIVWAVVTYSDNTLFPGKAALAPVLGTVALLVAGASGGLGSLWESGRWLAIRPARYIGRLSYSWYLWHWPMLMLVGVYFGVKRLPWAAGLAVVGAAFLVSILTLKLIENPMRHPRNLLVGLRRTGPALLFGVMLTAVSVGSGCWVVSNSEHLSAAPVVIAGKAPVITPDEATRNMGEPLPGCYGPEASTGDCYYGVLDSDTTVALIGDSMSLQWFGAAQQMAIANGWRLLMMPMPSCPITDVRVMKPPPDLETSRACHEFGRQVVDRLIRERPAVAILAARNGYQETMDTSGASYGPEESKALIAAGTARYVTELRNAGIKVAVMRDTPSFPSRVPSCVAENLAVPTDCDITVDSATLPDTSQLRKAVQAAGSSWVDALNWVCPGGKTCSVVDGSMIKFRDDHHMTFVFSQTLAPRLGDVIKRVMAGA